MKKHKFKDKFDASEGPGKDVDDYGKTSVRKKRKRAGGHHARKHKSRG